MKFKRKQFFCMGLSLATLALLTGCGNPYPDMTDEQYIQVVEYASGLLLKYSNNGVKKLTYLEPSVPVEGVDALPENMLQPETAESDTAASIPAVASLPEMEPDAEFPDVMFEDEEEAPADSGSEVSISQGDKQTLSNGATIGYNGYAVYNYYPLEMADVIISAELGNKLLVLSFTVENPTEEEIDLNMVVEDPVFRIAINHVEQGRYRPTILTDDLSTLIETLAPGERKSACLVVEVPEELSKEINSIGLSVKYEGKSQTAILN